MATASVLGKRSASDFSVVMPSKARRTTRSTRSSVVEETSAENDENLSPPEVLFADRDFCLNTPRKPKHTVSSNRIPLSPSRGNIAYKSAFQPITLDSPEKPIPKTPRRRDAAPKILTTPRRRVTVVGKLLTPRSQPSTPGTQKNLIPSIFAEAKLIFSKSTAPGRLVGRDKEREQLATYLDDRIKTCKGGCLYISGPPGTGKSALLNEVVSDITATATNVKRSYVNCMALKDGRGVYEKLAEDLLTATELESLTDIEGLENIFLSKTSKDVYLVTLDEIDHLLTKDQEILQSIFEWSLANASKLILIGIANALDLTTRFLPRLKARNLKPVLLPFLPYTAEQIESVIKSRLQSLLPDGCQDNNFVPYIHPAAISLCSKKVASQSGDLRKAFDICRRALELYDNELKQVVKIDAENEQEHVSGFTNIRTSPSLKKPLVDIQNFNPLATPHRIHAMVIPGPVEAPRVTIAHIARVSSSVFGGSAVQRVKFLNLQQKAVLASLSVLERKSAGKSPTLRALYEFYNSLCRKDKLLLQLSSTEFRDVIASLETASVVNMSTMGSIGTPSKRGKMVDERRISAAVGMIELMSSIGDVPIVKRIFLEP